MKALLRFSFLVLAFFTHSFFGNAQCNNNLSVFANSNGPLTCNDPCTELIAFPSGGTGQYIYTWSGPGGIISTTPNHYVCQPGAYTVVVTDDNNCTAETLVFVEEDYYIPVAYIYADPYDCTGGGTTLYADQSSQGWNIIYEWANPNGIILTGGNSTSIVVDAPGIYTLTVTDANNGCTSVAEILIEDNSAITEIKSLSNAFCPADNNQNTSCEKVCANSTAIYTVPGANGGNITWEVDGAISHSVDGDYLNVNWGDAGSGLITATSQGGGSSGDFEVICNLVSPDNINGATGWIAADIICGTPPFDYLWSNNTTTPEINNLQSGTYTVTVTDANGTTAVNSISVPASGSLILFYDVSQPSSCDTDDGVIAYNYTYNPPNNYTYQWSTGNTGNSLNNLPSGTYSLSISDLNNGNVSVRQFTLGCCEQNSNCPVDATICVEVLEEPRAEFTTQPAPITGKISICEGQSVFFNNQSTGALSYYWDFGNGNYSSDLDVEETYLTAGTYTASLIARNDCYCSDTSFVTILVENAISPEIQCLGTVCKGEDVTYSTDADCGIFNWVVSGNGTITDGGGTADNFITIDWQVGPIGSIELSVSGCTTNYCSTPTVEEIPILANGTPISGAARVCENEFAEYSVAEFGGTDFVWTVSAGGEIESGQGTNRITISWTGTPSTTTQQWVKLFYENCYLECGGESVYYVKILPEFYIENVLEVCAFGNSSLQTLNAENNNAFPSNWKVIAPNGVEVFSANNQNTISVDWLNGAGRYSVVAVPSNPDNFCTDRYLAYVNAIAPPPPAFGISGTSNVCPNNYYTYEVDASQPDAAFEWEIINGANVTAAEGKSINVLWGDIPPYKLSVKQISTTGLACESDATTLDVFPINAVLIAGSNNVCLEETANYSAPSFENADYVWSVTPADAGSILEGQGEASIEVLWHQNVTGNVQVSVCGVDANYAVTVFDLPQPQVNHPSGICPNTTVSVATTASYNNYIWKNEAGDVVSTAPSPDLGPGYFEVEVTDLNGCVNNETFYIEPFPTPEIKISVDGTRVLCFAQGDPPAIVQALDTDGGYTYEWFHDGSSLGLTTTSITTSDYGFYQVVATDENGCVATSNTLQLHELCIGTSPGTCNNPGLAIICEQGTHVTYNFAATPECNVFTFKNTSPNFIPGTVEWDFDDPQSGADNFASGNDATHTFSYAGKFIVTQTAQSVVLGQSIECWDAHLITVPVAADFNYEEGCVGSSIQFEDLSTFIPEANITNWEWDFGDPVSGANNTSTDQHPAHIFSFAGNYNVRLTITNQTGCISSFEKTIIVHDLPTVNFAQPIQNCQGAALNFNAITSSEVTSVSWNFGDSNSGAAANTSQNFLTHHVYETPGVYTVILTAESIYGCSNTFFDQVTVEPNGLSGNISTFPGNSICEGYQVTMSPPPGGTIWEWSDGSTTENITTEETGTFDVTLTDANGCTHVSPVVAIDVIPLPNASIQAVEYNEFDQAVAVFYDNFSACEGENVFLEIEGSPDYTYTWTGGDTGMEISFTEERENLLTAGTYEFNITITDNVSGCSNVAGPMTVVIHPVPTDIQISSNPPLPICENNPITLSIDNPDSTFTYIWNNGELGTSINITGVAGEYFVRAITPFGCQGESEPLTIYPAPDFRKVPSGCHTRCEPDTICLPTLSNVVNYQWYFNGSPIPAPQGDVPDLIALESGEYILEMTDAGGCQTTSDPLNLDLFTGFGNIHGIVYLDVNQNGIIDAGDTPYENANILLTDGTTTLNNAGSALDGSYFFPNILSTNYTLMVDENSLPLGTEAIISQANVTLSGCDDDEIMDWLVQVTCVNSTFLENSTLCLGDSILINGTVYDQNSSTGTETIQNSTGCDSIITIDLNFYTPAEAELNSNLCFGESIEVNGVMYDQDNPTGNELLENEAANGCDSMVLINLTFDPQIVFDLNPTICPDETITVNGNIYDLNNPSGSELLENEAANGCDSTININLDFFTLPQGELNSNLCFGESIEVNGVIYDQDNPTGNELLENEAANGCDSLVTINLTFDPQIVFDLNPTICPDETITVNGNIYDLNNPSGSELLENEAANGCDSIVNINLDFFTLPQGELNSNLCFGESIEVNGVIYDQDNPTGNELLENEAANGCDSLVTINLTFDPQIVFDLNPTICPDETITINGNIYDLNNPSGIELLENEAANGCDSTVNINLNFLTLPQGELNSNLCFGESIEVNGVIYDQNNPAGNELLENEAANGCDSIVTINLAFSNEVTFDLSPFICEDGSIIVNGNTYDQTTPTGTETFINGSISGCDSTVNIALQFYPPSAGTLTSTLCFGESISVNGTIYDQNNLSGSELLENASSNGCDSVVFVTVDILPQNKMDLELAACNGEPVIFDGTILQPGTTTPFTFQDQTGCDSTVQVQVVEQPLDFNPITQKVCVGEKLEYNGQQLSAGSQTEFTFTNQAGCDSVVLITVEEFPAMDFELSADPACPNSTDGEIEISITSGTAPFAYSLDGNATQTASNFTFTNLFPTEYTLSIQDGNGCEAEATIEIPTIPNIIFTIEPQPLPCDGGDISFSPIFTSGNISNLTYQWSTGSTTSVLSTNEPGMYSLQVNNECETVQQEFQVDYKAEGNRNYLYLPNAFSPNEDGKNDIFKAYPAGDIIVDDFEFYIFNRWGDQLYNTQNVEDGWNGFFQNKMMQPGVYVWFVRANITRCGRTFEWFEKGDVTIMR